MQVSDKELEDLIKQASKRPPMTEAERREQRRSFVYGNCKIENPLVTREMVIRVDEQMTARDRK